MNNNNTNVVQLPTPEKKVKLMSITELFVEKELEWLADGMLPVKSFCVMFGAPGSCKSFLALSLSLALAHGTEWRGVTQDKKAVAYIAAEGFHGLNKRVKAWLKHQDISPVDEHFRLIPEAVSLLDDDAITGLVAQLKEHEETTGVKFELVVIDTLARSMLGADENHSGQMGIAIAGADKIKNELGAAVLLIHHSGKDENRGARGSNALKGACDAEWKIERTDSKLKLHLAKMKDAEDGFDINFELKKIDLDNDKHGKPLNSLVVVPFVEHDGRDISEDEQKLMTIAKVFPDDGEYYCKELLEKSEITGLRYNTPNTKKLFSMITEQGRVVIVGGKARRFSISNTKKIRLQTVNFDDNSVSLGKTNVQNIVDSIRNKSSDK